MSLRRLQLLYGLSYGKLKKLTRMPGFPLIEGVVFPQDFDNWRKEYFQRQRTADAGHKAGGLTLTSGLLAFLHLVTELQLGEVLLPW